MDPMEFSAYIYTFPDAAVENLCSIFEKDIPDIEYDNAGDKLAELFITIITEVADAEKKKSAPKDARSFGEYTDIAPEITAENAGRLFFIDQQLTLDLEVDEADEEEIHPFQKYLDALAQQCSFPSSSGHHDL